MQTFALEKLWPTKYSYVAGPSQMPQLGKGPYVVTPGRSGCYEPIPTFFNDKLLWPRYQEAHDMYDQMQVYFANQAYNNQNWELVVVKAPMMILKPRKIKLAIFEVHTSS
jgi:hypothetical protein